MPTYWNLLQLIFPVFALVAIGALVRRVHWIEGPAETSLIRLVVNLCYPCFIFDAVIGNTAPLTDFWGLLVDFKSGIPLVVPR